MRRMDSAPAVLAMWLLGALMSGGHAEAQTQMRWLDVPGTPGAAQAIDLACDRPDSSYRLYATITTQEDISDFFAMDALVMWGPEVGRGGPPTALPPFFHFETGGCNAGALMVSYAKPAGVALPSPWGPGGSLVDQAYISYSVPDEYAGRLRVVLILAAPVILRAGQSFGFTIDLSSCFAGSCQGCQERMRASFAEAYLWRTDNSHVLVQASGESDACMNTNGWCGLYAPQIDAIASAEESRPLPAYAGPCGPTSTRESTWGELKIRYR